MMHWKKWHGIEQDFINYLGDDMEPSRGSREFPLLSFNGADVWPWEYITSIHGIVWICWTFLVRENTTRAKVLFMKCYLFIFMKTWLYLSSVLLFRRTEILFGAIWKEMGLYCMWVWCVVIPDMLLRRCCLEVEVLHPYVRHCDVVYIPSSAVEASSDIILATVTRLLDTATQWIQRYHSGFYPYYTTKYYPTFTSMLTSSPETVKH